MNERHHTKEWVRYGNNPHIERNSLTKEFRCITCKLSLGDNAGGAGSHCKGSHRIRINGTQIVKEPLKTDSKVIIKHEEAQPEQDVLKRMETPLQIESEPNLDEGDSLKFLEVRVANLIKYRKFKALGAPESDLKLLRKLYGIEGFFEEEKTQEGKFEENLKMIFYFMLANAAS